MSAWKPIETAPKDGTRVLLSNANGTWMGEFKEQFKDDRPWFSVLLNHWHMSPYCSTEPTHWQPLPSPPEAL